MASQMFGVTGNRRLKRNQKSELNARLSQLPSILAAEQAADQQRRQQEFNERELAQNKRIARDEMKFKRQEAKRGFGLEVGKLGVNIGMSDMLGTKTLGELGGDIKQLGAKIGIGGKPTVPGKAGTVSGPSMMTSKSGGGFFSNLPIGSIAAGGLAGFGAGSMFGEKGGIKKSLFGGLAGAGLGLLSGGGLSSAIGGGLGGMFGGLLG